MGIFSNALTWRHCRVSADPPSDFRARFADAIARNALRENERIRTKDENVGWVAINDPGDTALSIEKVLFNTILALSMRVDKKRVSAHYLKIMVARRRKAVLEAEGKTRLSANQKKAIREEIEEDLLGRALPHVAVYDMAWNIVKGDVYFFSLSKPVFDLFQTLFRNTFEIDLHPVGLEEWLETGQDRELVEAAFNGLEPTIWTPSSIR